MLQALADKNDAYLRKFGHIFIVCAAGRSAPQMLENLELRCATRSCPVSCSRDLHADADALTPRLHNMPHEELLVAANEQWKITELRLGKMWFGPGGRPPPPASPAAGRAEQRAGLLHAHLGARVWQTEVWLRVPLTLCLQQGGQVLLCIPGHASAVGAMGRARLAALNARPRSARGGAGRQGGSHGAAARRCTVADHHARAGHCQGRAGKGRACRAAPALFPGQPNGPRRLGAARRWLDRRRRPLQ